jgi:hypothetical protein
MHSESDCRYELWYKVGKRDDQGIHICIDYFTLIAIDSTISSSVAATIATTEYVQSNRDSPVNDIKV